MTLCAVLHSLNILMPSTKVEGCDGFIVGPCDLSGSIGLLNETKHPKVVALMKTAIEKCKAAGKPIGVAAAYTPEDVKFWYDLGFQFLSAGTDTAAIIARAQEQVAVMSKIFKQNNA